MNSGPAGTEAVSLPPGVLWAAGRPCPQTSRWRPDLAGGGRSDVADELRLAWVKGRSTSGPSVSAWLTGLCESHVRQANERCLSGSAGPLGWSWYGTPGKARTGSRSWSRIRAVSKFRAPPVSCTKTMPLLTTGQFRRFFENRRGTGKFLSCFDPARGLLAKNSRPVATSRNRKTGHSHRNQPARRRCRSAARGLCTARSRRIQYGRGKPGCPHSRRGVPRVSLRKER